jgi:glycosyltransferase involved in cell wall biosynthesis
VVNRRFAFAVPGDLATPTGGYAYDRRVAKELGDLGWQVEVVALGADFPRPSSETLAHTLTALDALPEGMSVLIDGLALGAMPDIAMAICERHPLIALVHHPLALETGLSFEEQEAFRASEREALTCARHVIATSGTTARLLETDYGVAASAITVARPGMDPVAAAGGENRRSDDGVLRLLAVGSVIPRKGYDVLIAALAELRDLPWRLTIAGACDRHIEASVQLLADIVRFDLQDRVDAAGAVSDERLAALHVASDLFVLASRYEGYGMAYAEAIAYGLPVIGTTGGAIPEVVPEDAGVLVPPDDVAALRAALRRLIADGEARRRHAEAARQAALRLPRWRDTAQRIATVMEAFG